MIRAQGMSRVAAIAVAFGVCGAAGLSGCGGGGGAASSPHQQVVTDASQLLASVRFPPGSRRSSSQPAGGAGLVPNPTTGVSGVGGSQLQKPPTGSTATVVSGWWVANGSIDRVAAWLQRHSPAAVVSTAGGASRSSTATGPKGRGHTVTTSEAVDYVLAPAGHLALREILVTLVRGKHGTAIAYVQAESAWTKQLSPGAQTAAKECLTGKGIKVLADFPAVPSSLTNGQPRELGGELLISVAGSKGAFIGFYTSPDGAQKNRPRLEANAKTLGGAVHIVGSEAVMYTDPPAAATASRIESCLK